VGAIFDLSCCLAFSYVLLQRRRANQEEAHETAKIKIGILVSEGRKEMSKWSGVRGSISVEISRDNGEFIDVDGKTLPESVSKELEPIFIGVKDEDVYAELVIDFTSSGYYTPMSMYGGPDHLGWPEEGEDERTISGTVTIYWRRWHSGGGSKSELSQKASDDLFDAYLDKIESQDLEYDDYDPPDYDDYDPPDYDDYAECDY
jgi:hypothetical protein